ncbi:Poa1p_like family protein with Macro domain [Erwinia phage FBB1]|nr:Poa1p_like family protein with Macro domain [Erwinia phage FBB1]
MISYTKGDIVKIFGAGHDIAHGCNCMCSMGGGVAAQLAVAFPQISESDDLEDDYYAFTQLKLGKYSSAATEKGNICYNLYTQHNPGPNVDYGAILNAFINLRKERQYLCNKKPIYIPRIGAGIAGGHWPTIEKLINIACPDINIIVVDYDEDAAIPNSYKEASESIEDIFAIEKDIEKGLEELECL